MMPPASEGLVVKRIWLPVVPRLWPAPATKLTVPPPLRVKLAKVRLAFCPAPAVDETVELPAPRVRPATFSDEVAAALPRKLSVPPLSVTVLASLMRLLLL